jgi:hypothetical protein
MANRKLTADELKRANELFDDIREELRALAPGDPLLLFAYRRKVVKELGYDERGKPSSRATLKSLKWRLQNRQCAHCGKQLLRKYSELDRKNAAGGYTVDNTELVHPSCHQERQAAKRNICAKGWTWVRGRIGASSGSAHPADFPAALSWRRHCVSNIHIRFVSGAYVSRCVRRHDKLPPQRH